MIIVLFIPTTLSVAEDAVRNPKHFKVVFEITYNDETLKQAARIEAIVNRVHANACKVKMKLEEVIPNSGGIYIIDSDENVGFNSINWDLD